MSLVWFMVPVALGLGLLFLALFVGNARSDQYEDLHTPAIRILMDERGVEKSKDAEARKV